MKGGAFRVEIERFLLAEESGTDPRLLLDVWIGADPPAESITLLLPDHPPIGISDPGMREHREGFVHGAARQHLDALSDPSVLAEARVDIRYRNGDSFEVAVGSFLRVGPAPAALPEEVRLMSLGGDPGLDTLSAERCWPASDLFARDAAHDPYALADALEEDLAALLDPGDLLLFARDEAWTATSHRYGFRFRADADPATTSRDAARTESAARIAHAVEECRAVLSAPVPLLIRAASASGGEEERDALHRALLRRNARACLLWADPAWGDDPADIERVDTGLIHSAAGDWRSLVAGARRIMTGLGP